MEEIPDMVIKMNESNQNTKENNTTKTELSTQLNINSSTTEKAVNKLLESVGIVGSGHSIVCLLHITFKIAALVIYILGGLVLSSTSVFLFVSIFEVIDFWIVKNVSGRLNKETISRIKMVE